jgi:hypothetical protein
MANGKWQNIGVGDPWESGRDGKGSPQESFAPANEAIPGWKWHYTKCIFLGLEKLKFQMCVCAPTALAAASLYVFAVKSRTTLI